MKSQWRARIIQGVIALLIAVAGFAVARWLQMSAPESGKHERPYRPLIVDTLEVSPGPVPVEVEITGLVQPAREAVLSPQVTGAVVWVNAALRPGYRAKEGEALVRLDPTDYQVALAQAQSALAQAEASLSIVRGEEATAKAEYALIGRRLSPEEEALALKQPQVANAQAVVTSARAAVRKAEVDLERTVIKAPFEGVIGSFSISEGSRVSVGQELMRLVRDDLFWVLAEVPKEALSYLHPKAREEAGTPVRFLGGAVREGELLEVLPSVDEAVRRPRVLLALPHPLGSDRPIPSGSYLQASLEGSPVQNAVALPFYALREGESVWILEEGKLHILPVQVRFQAKTHLIVQGIDKTVQVITSRLNGAVEGMPLKAAGSGRGGKE